MRIGIFTNAYHPIISGVVNCISLFRLGLKARGHRVYIFAPGFPGYPEPHAGIFRYPSLNLTRKVKFPVAIPCSCKIDAILPRLKLDLIHAHHPIVLGEAGARAAKRLHIPLVYTFHTQVEQYTHYIPLNQALLKRLARSMVQKFARKCSLILCPGRSILELLREYGISEQVHWFPNAIDLSAFSNQDPGPIRARYGLTPQDRVLLYVGRMGREKNLPFLLQTFAQVASRIARVTLMVVGEGPELESLKALAASLGIGDRTVFTGRVEYRDIPPYYAAAHLFLMTSLTEVKPLVLLEALASGLPVVAVDAAGTADTVTDKKDGLLTPLDQGAYVNAVTSVLEQPSRWEEMRRCALATAKSYSLEVLTERLLEHYQQAVRGFQERRRGEGI